MTDVAVVGFAHAPARAPHRRHHQRRRDADAVLRRALRRTGPQADRHRLLVLGIVGLPCRPRILVHLRDRLDRCGPADQRVARRDGRRVGALRGLHQDPDRRRSTPRWSTGSASPSAGTLRRVLALQTDPYTVAPLWPDSVSIAGPAGPVRSGRRQVDRRADGPGGAGLVRGRRSRTDSEKPGSQASIDELLARPYFADPLRRHDIAPITDGASAIVLAAGDKARELRENPAWITGFEHRIETPVLGARDLTTSPSTAASAKAATGGDAGSIDVAELYAPFTHQQLILTEAIGLAVVDEGQPVRRRAGRQPDVLGGPGAHRLRRPAHLRRLRAAGAGARHQRACAATESGRRPGRESS